MKLAYAFRRTALYPYTGGTGWEIPPDAVRGRYLRTVRTMGFEGIEIGYGQGVGTDETSIRALGAELAAAGVPCAAVRAGGGFLRPQVAQRSREAIAGGIAMAAWLGAAIVNLTVTMPTGIPAPGEPGGGVGSRTSPGSSRSATIADYDTTASELRALADLAAAHGVTFSVELHQHSIADNPWSCLHLLGLIDRPNVGLNPDLGNLYWHYERPEVSNEDAIVALAPHTKYWHCKQLQRLQIPEHERSYFLLVPLPDGEIDYRFAIAAMHAAGYDGWLAIEGCRDGDQIRNDGRSAAYCKEILAELDASASA
jgi:sugar phosphate isomerase/epimerase